MKYQFQAEDHNRQDKTKKADYVGEMIERGRSEGLTEMERISARIEAKKNWVRKIRQFRFFLNGMQFRFDWPLEHFAKINGLPPTEQTTKAAFDALKESATDDMKLIGPAIMKGKVKPRRLFVGMFKVWDVEFDVPKLKCDEIKK